MVHVPAATMVTVLELIRHTDGVSEVRLTVKPEEAVTAMTKGCSPNARSAGATNAIVCCAPPMTIVKAWVASGATPFDAVNFTEKLPIWVGVPLIRPVAVSSVSPGGNAGETE